MRAVTTAQSMRRSYNRVIDGDGSNNPYQSMYSQAFGGREDQSKTMDSRFSTPQKAQIKVKSSSGNFATSGDER